jgi:hypothetical protein
MGPGARTAGSMGPGARAAGPMGPGARVAGPMGPGGPRGAGAEPRSKSGQRETKEAKHGLTAATTRLGPNHRQRSQSRHSSSRSSSMNSAGLQIVDNQSGTIKGKSQYSKYATQDRSNIIGINDNATVNTYIYGNAQKKGDKSSCSKSSPSKDRKDIECETESESECEWQEFKSPNYSRQRCREPSDDENNDRFNSNFKNLKM